MSLNGYNVEDAILVNEASVKEDFLEQHIILHMKLVKKVQKCKEQTLTP